MCFMYEFSIHKGALHPGGNKLVEKFVKARKL